MLQGRSSNLLLIALVLLLGVQLTGLTCLGEWQLGPAAGLIEGMGHSPSPDGGVADDGCPCHFVFQSMSLPAPDILSPLADEVNWNPTLYVPTFVVALFHPPLSV